MHDVIQGISEITDPAMEVLDPTPRSLAIVGEQSPYEDMPLMPLQSAASSDRLRAPVNKNNLRTGVVKVAMAVAAFLGPNMVVQSPAAANHCTVMGLPANCPGETPTEVLPAPKEGEGYAGATNKGEIIYRGDRNFACDGLCVDLGGVALNQDIIDSEFTRTGRGQWMVGADGGVFASGDAGFYGSTGGMRLNERVVGMARTASGNGYWTVARDGGVFTFGDAGFYGSTGGIRLNKPVVGMAATATGNGYWLVASDGGIFSFGDAVFRGSAGGAPLQKPVVGMAAKSDGGGYWMVASDGGVFNYGSAGFFGSTGGQVLNKPVKGIAAHHSGEGYYEVAVDGGVFAFGKAATEGWQGSLQTAATRSGNESIVSIDALTNEMVAEEEILAKTAA